MRRRFLQLRYEIRNAGYEYFEFAETIGLTAPQLSARLNGRAPWKMCEVLKACKKLDISTDRIGDVFADSALGR